MAFDSGVLVVVLLVLVFITKANGCLLWTFFFFFFFLDTSFTSVCVYLLLFFVFNLSGSTCRQICLITHARKTLKWVSGFVLNLELFIMSL